MSIRSRRPNLRNRDFPISVLDKGYVDNHEVWEDRFGKAFTDGEKFVEHLQKIVVKLKKLGVKSFRYHTPHGGNFWIDEEIVQDFCGSYTTRNISEWTETQLLVAEFCDIFEYGYCYQNTGVSAVSYKLTIYEDIEGISRLNIGTSWGNGLGINIK